MIKVFKKLLRECGNHLAECHTRVRLFQEEIKSIDEKILLLQYRRTRIFEKLITGWFIEQIEEEYLTKQPKDPLINFISLQEEIKQIDKEILLFQNRRVKYLEQLTEQKYLMKQTEERLINFVPKANIV